MSVTWTRRSWLAGAATSAATCATTCAVTRHSARADAAAGADRPVRIWGPAAMEDVIGRLADGYAAARPGGRVEAKLMGSDTAIPGLYAGLADIALLGRENNVTDDNGFGRVKGYKPSRLEIMGGSLGTRDHTPALAVFVARESPVRALTLAQIAAVATCGANDGLVLWSQLGVDGAFGAHPAHLYLETIESGTGDFFLRTVLHGSRKLNWAHVDDFADGADGAEPASSNRAATRAIAALTRDPYGIAIADLDAAVPSVRPIAIAATADTRAVALTRESVIDRTYPLARRTYAFVDRRPGTPLLPEIEGFLRYAIGDAGQAKIDGCGTYLPLDAATRSSSLRTLASAAHP